MIPQRKGLVGALIAFSALTVGCIGIAACSHLQAKATTEIAPSAVADLAPPDATSTPRVRLLTQAQYSNMISDVFGSDIRAGTPIPPFNRTDGLVATGAASTGVTTGQLMQLQRAAASIARQVVDEANPDRGQPSHRNFLVPCQPKSLSERDDACAARYIRATGRLLFRRPLSEDQIRVLVAQAGDASSKLHSFYDGLSAVTEGMLLDPMVLLVVDTMEPDPEHPGRKRLDAYSYATRLSLFLWNSVPDDALLAAAEKGDLDTERGRAAAVDRMLASPRLDNGVRAFFDDLFGFDAFDTLAKDPTIYPAASGTALKEAREQTLRTVVDHLITKKRDYRDLFTTRETFMSPALAAVYDVPAVKGWTRYTFPSDSPRAGLQSQISFLAAYSHPGRSSPTLRGKAMRESLLCQKVPPPPPDVDFSTVANPDPSLRTARERLTVHRTLPACAGCHQVMDPMGLVLENFDGAGRFRSDENGARIDTSGNLDGKSFDSVAGLGQALHDHPRLPSCLVRRTYAYGVGGPLTQADDPMVPYLTKRFASAGYRYPDLLRTIALSPAFRNVSEPPVAPAKSEKVAAK